MSMSAFLFAADALRLEEGWSFHVETAPGEKPVVDPAVSAKNAESMAMMGAMLGGISGAPKVAR